MRAWGDDESGQTDVPAGLSDVVAISAGNGFGLALKADSKLPEYLRGALKIKDKPLSQRLRFFFDYLESNEVPASGVAAAPAAPTAARIPGLRRPCRGRLVGCRRHRSGVRRSRAARATASARRSGPGRRRSRPPRQRR